MINVVLTAHPDDESMFFVPTILSLLDAGEIVCVLCLTTGNYDGLGKVRSSELISACNGCLLVEKVILLDDLQDHPQKPWNISDAVNHIRGALQQIVLDHHKTTPTAATTDHIRLITFDEGGVSGHINHRDTYYAARQLYFESLSTTRSDPLSLELWFLETVRNPLRKYLPLYEWCLLSMFWFRIQTRRTARRFISNDRVMHLSFSPAINWKAMQAHWSQFVWYRRLFVIFSCYTYSNVLEKLSADNTTSPK